MNLQKGANNMEKKKQRVRAVGIAYLPIVGDLLDL